MRANVISAEKREGRRQRADNDRDRDVCGAPGLSLLAAMIKQAARDANRRGDRQAAEWLWAVAPTAAAELLDCDASDQEESSTMMILGILDDAVRQTFLHTLGRLPTSDQAAIKKRLTLATDDRDRAAKHGGDVAAHASVSTTGVLWLDSAELKRQAKGCWRHVENVVAHECAHVVLEHHRASKADVGIVEGEIAADKLAQSWGYDSLVSFDSLHPQRTGGYPQPFGEIEL